MNTNRKERYYNKLQFLEKRITWLLSWTENNTLSEIEKNNDYKALMAIYHVAQNSTEVVSDINAMLCKDLAHIVQDKYQNLEYVITKKIIPLNLKVGLSELFGLRNRLANEYDGIINQYAWDAIIRNITTLEEFHKGVTKWVEENVK